MKTWVSYVLFIGIAIFTEVISGALTSGSMKTYELLQKPAPDSSRHPLSHCMDGAVPAYGHRRRQDLSDRCRGSQTGADSLGHPAGCKFCMEPDFLQRRSVSRGFSLASAPLGTGSGHDFKLPRPGPDRRPAADSLSAMDHLRRLLKCLHLETESVIPPGPAAHPDPTVQNRFRSPFPRHPPDEPSSPGGLPGRR